MNKFKFASSFTTVGCFALIMLIFSGCVHEKKEPPVFIWWEAEDAISHDFPATNMFEPNNEREKAKLSGGKWLQTDKGGGATAKWEVELAREGTYNLWVRKLWRHGPFKWRFNDQPEQHCTRQCALIDSVDLRQHVCANWVPLGKVTLPQGKNTLSIKLDDEATFTAFDSWLITDEDFIPNGALKPGEKYNLTEPGWFNFEPDTDKYTDDSMFDFRFLNQEYAGEDGFLKANGPDIVYGDTGEKVKFWAVNAGAPSNKKAADYLARKLAKYGVNLVRLHASIHDKLGDPADINGQYLDDIHYFIAALAKQGIYTKLSYYFPLWHQMSTKYKIPGYVDKDKRKPFGLIFFEPRTQEIYKGWVKKMMTTENPYTRKSLADDPAVGMVEIVNEDGLFFWSFIPYKTLPDECTYVLEKLFGDWLKKKYGSIEEAVAVWGKSGNPPEQAGDISKGRVGLYMPGFFGSFDWAKKARNFQRARDQLTFTVELQRGFYKNMSDHFKNDLGVKCLISASNWHTVDPKNLAALEKYTYTVCDVIDRHGYYNAIHKGEHASWSVRNWHTFTNKSGLLGPDSLTKELQYSNMPHMISEYNYPTPNRFRAEGVYMASTYGSLSGTDAFFYFSMASSNWQNTNTKFPVYTPSVMGQFPVYSYIYRKGLVKEGATVADITYSLKDLLDMKGTDIVESVHMDELRKKDIVKHEGTQTEIPQIIDPIAYYVGQVKVDFSKDKKSSKIADLTKYIDRKKKTVKSSNDSLFWDWGNGVSTVNTPKAQGACGFLQKAGKIELDDVVIESENEYVSIIVTAIDGKPIKKSKKIMVQVMTEDRNYGFKSEPVKGDPEKKSRIVSIGEPPMLVKNFKGKITVNIHDAEDAELHALDFNGYKQDSLGRGSNGKVEVDLKKDVLYYIISK